MNGWVALGAGLVTGGLVAFVLTKLQGEELGVRGQALQASLVRGGDDLRTAFLAQRREIEAELSRAGQEEAESYARIVAEHKLASIAQGYGLTPTRVRKLNALYERWS